MKALGLILALCGAVLGVVGLFGFDSTDVSVCVMRGCFMIIALGTMAAGAIAMGSE